MKYITLWTFPVRIDFLFLTLQETIESYCTISVCYLGFLNLYSNIYEISYIYSRKEIDITNGYLSHLRKVYHWNWLITSFNHWNKTQMLLNIFPAHIRKFHKFSEKWIHTHTHTYTVKVSVYISECDNVAEIKILG